VRSRFSFGLGGEVGAVWSPDGKRIAFASDREGRHFGIFVQDVGASTQEQPLLIADGDAFPMSWSPDGRYLAYQQIGGEGEATGGTDIWLLPVSEPAEPRPLVRTRFVEPDFAFSPDGRWMAYVSNESGRFEVYAQPWPAGGGKWQISTQGGVEVGWGRDSRSIYYRDMNGTLVAVGVTPRGEALEVGPPRSLFQDRRLLAWELPDPAGRFLVLLGDEAGTASELKLVVNWPALLER
jgi:Tol biopolymer transport system component